MHLHITLTWEGRVGFVVVVDHIHNLMEVVDCIVAVVDYDSSDSLGIGKVGVHNIEIVVDYIHSLMEVVDCIDCIVVDYNPYIHNHNPF